MGLHKGELEIGFRADEEIRRVFSRRSKAMRALRLSKHTVYSFKEGTTPSGYVLAKLCESGCDVEYILTGKRKAGGSGSGKSV